MTRGQAPPLSQYGIRRGKIDSQILQANQKYGLCSHKRLLRGSEADLGGSYLEPDGLSPSFPCPQALRAAIGRSLLLLEIDLCESQSPRRSKGRHRGVRWCQVGYTSVGTHTSHNPSLSLQSSVHDGFCATIHGSSMDVITQAEQFVHTTELFAARKGMGTGTGLLPSFRG